MKRTTSTEVGARPPLSILQWKIIRFLLRKDCPDDCRWFHFEGKHSRLTFCYCNANKEIGAVATAEAMALIKTPYVVASTDEYRTSYRLTPLGKEMFDLGEPPFIPPPLPALREIEHEVLQSLDYPDFPWKTPQHCGGRNGSGHSEALYRITLHGLAEMRKNIGEEKTGTAAFPRPQLFRRGKGSRRFRITAAGVALNRTRHEERKR